MPKTSDQHIHLIGNSSENFYSLGKRDKDSFTQVYDHISRLCVRNNLLAKIIKSTTEFSSRFTKKSHNFIVDDLKAYAEGLERPLEDVLFAQLLPEMVASFNKWSPDLLSLVPGCSSLFYWDEKDNGVIHTRVLDYALSGPFENFERSILYDFPDRYKTFSYSSAGLALPGLSAMNEKGLSLALHYKHSDYFNQEGESIFFLASQILYQCDSIRDAHKFLRNRKSISFWGLYITDPSGEVLSLDIRGNEFAQEKFDIKDHEYLYFNNKSLVRKNSHEKLQPYGHKNQCQMRDQSIKKIINIDKVKKSKAPQKEILKQISSPKPTKSKDAKNWNLLPTTPSSIQCYNFHNTKFESLFNLGTAPKFFKSYLLYKDIFSNLNVSTQTTKSKQSDYKQAYEKLALYQSHLDKNEIPEAYHQIQMAVELFSGYPEQYISQFFFYVTEYLFEVDQRDLAYIYEDFKSLQGKLPHYLEDHIWLFLLRLGKILGHEIKNNENKIENNNLKDQYRTEFNLNALSIKGLKYLTFPRVEILDIIYAY